mmetsp:Transcript_114720/g.171579  ORF Transcript_114720/g.171579 Transcript_114720/m.171579 type:complete len:259 (-) Transcript_114720:259-1035(-)
MRLFSVLFRCKLLTIRNWPVGFFVIWHFSFRSCSFVTRWSLFSNQGLCLSFRLCFVTSDDRRSRYRRHGDRRQVVVRSLDVTHNAKVTTGTGEDQHDGHRQDPNETLHGNLRDRERQFLRVGTTTAIVGIAVHAGDAAVRTPLDVARVVQFAPMAKGGTEGAVGTRRLRGAGGVLLRFHIVAGAGLSPGATVSTSPRVTGAVVTPMAAVRGGAIVAIVDGRAGVFERDIVVVVYVVVVVVVVSIKFGLPGCLQLGKRQ